jgi:hypothetical protein
MTHDLCVRGQGAMRYLYLSLNRCESERLKEKKQSNFCHNNVHVLCVLAAHLFITCQTLSAHLYT